MQVHLFFRKSDIEQLLKLVRRVNIPSSASIFNIDVVTFWWTIAHFSFFLNNKKIIIILRAYLCFLFLG